MSEDHFAAMRQTIIDGAPSTASALAQSVLERGADALEAIDHGFVPGMHYVGEQFELRKMFLPDMLASAEAMKAAMSVLEPALKQQGSKRPTLGTVLLGTTRGDIHEIGKTLVGTLLTAHGFRVHDLGVDVSSKQFAVKARELEADIVGISALLTTTMAGQKSVIEVLDREGLRPRVKVMVGGAPVTRRWAQEIGADGYGKDAVSAVSLAMSLMETHAGQR